MLTKCVGCGWRNATVKGLCEGCAIERNWLVIRAAKLRDKGRKDLQRCRRCRTLPAMRRWCQRCQDLVVVVQGVVRKAVTS